VQPPAHSDTIRLPRQAPVVGIVVCGSKNERTLRYTLDGSAQPLTVTSYTTEALQPRSLLCFPPWQQRQRR